MLSKQLIILSIIDNNNWDNELGSNRSSNSYTYKSYGYLIESANIKKHKHAKTLLEANAKAATI